VFPPPTGRPRPRRGGTALPVLDVIHATSIRSRNIFRDRPDLLAVLGDDEHLASLPAGSLGHAYRSFLATNRLDAGVFSEADIIRPLAEKNNWDEDFYYMIRRGTAVHDLFHTISGYGPDMVGEVLNLGFHCGQIEPAGPVKHMGRLFALITPGASVRFKLRCYQQAVERGRRADCLMAAPWEELLPQPYAEVQDVLGVAPTEQAHPDGMWFTE
jgi:ubiquinone biosynthesis protein Coq4